MIPPNIERKEKLLSCDKFSKKPTKEIFDIRQQLFKAFGYNKKDEEFYMEKRRGAVRDNTIDLGNNNRILHIRKTWDSQQKMTPTSSIQTSEFSKIN